MVVAIRGAITVTTNTKSEILTATQEMIQALMDQNQLQETDLISLFFTTTADLNAAFPAEAARQCGLSATPLMCATEIPVPNSLPKCIRVLAHCNSNLTKNSIRHIYLRDAVALRTDLIKG